VLDRGIPNQHAEAGSAFSYTLPGDAFKDENGDQLSYSISALPSGWSFNPASKTITATPLTAGTINVNVNASDGNGASGTANFQITVHHPGTYAAFKMDYQMGCGYRQVRFTNLSKGASSYNWTFGNGNTSTLANPSAIYNTPGRYRVTLLINQGLATESTHSEYIYIYPRPKPAIGAVGVTGCEPVDLTISSTGTPVLVAAKTINGQNVEAITGGTDSYHYWYFFEKHPATFNTSPPNVNVSQLADGKYNVLLEVTDQYGCQASATAFELFEVDDRPEAAFTYTKSNSCEPSLTVFNDASTVKNSTVSNYQWTINNNSVSEDKAEISFDFSPLGTGSYPVSLVTTSAKGCVSEVYHDTLSFNTINSVDFLTDPLYYTGDTIHLKALSVEPALSYQWHVDNNNSIESKQQAFDYTFLTPGIHPVKLIAAYPDACELELVKNLNIDQVTASFSYTTDYKCSVDSFEVSFTNTSTTHLGNQIVSQNWYLIDGDSTLLSTEAQFTHTLANEGDYVVLLETTDINNRKGNITDTLTLNTPGVKLYVTDGTLSCFDGSPTKFRADFESDFERAVSYSWDFGDGQTGTGATPDHIYAAPGAYDISVSVTTNKGCTYTASRSEAVELGFKPVIDKVVPVNASSCYNDGVELEITYTGAIDQLWLIDTNNRREYTNPGTSPYQFNYAFEDTGKFEIQIITSMNGCFSDTTIVKDVLVDGPRAEFSPSQNTFCAAPYDVTFYNNSSYEKSNTSFTWDFGDGTTRTTDDATQSHSYTATGSYDITLTATNTLTGCTNSYTETIDIFSFDDSGAVITADVLTGCVPLTVNFTEQLTSRFSSNYNSQLFEWDFNNDGIVDDTTSNSDIEYTFTQPGSYDVRIVAVGADGCNYEYLATDFIRVKGPIVDFNHAPALTCTDTEITFSNQSTKPFFDTAIPANDVFTWNFGDGNSSTLENPKHLYAVDSVYTVSLTIEDQNGCIATKTDSQLVNIIPFEPALALADTVTCSNNSIVFSNQSTGNIVSFKWDFDGNGTVDSTTYDLSSIEYSYPVSGSYKALLTAEVADGCAKSHLKETMLPVD
jgi:PKD repeat protein